MGIAYKAIKQISITLHGPFYIAMEGRYTCQFWGYRNSEWAAFSPKVISSKFKNFCIFIQAIQYRVKAEEFFLIPIYKIHFNKRKLHKTLRSNYSLQNRKLLNDLGQLITVWQQNTIVACCLPNSKKKGTVSVTFVVLGDSGRMRPLTLSGLKSI